MPVWLAEENALDMAEYVFTDPEMTWSDYGAGPCTRINRSKVDCYSYVTEDVYDDYGYYLDSVLCDWSTVTYYPRFGKAKVWASKPECVLLSEV